MVGVRLVTNPGAGRIVPPKLPPLPPKVPPPPGSPLSSGFIGGIAGGILGVIVSEALFPQSTAPAALDEIPPELLKPPGSGTVIQEESPATPTGWQGGTLPDTFYYLWYQVPVLNATNTAVESFSTLDSGFGTNTFSDLQLLASGQPVPLFHWNYEGTGIPPGFPNRNRLYSLQHVRNGTTQQTTGLGNFVGVKILGFSPSNQTFSPAPGDQAFNDDAEPPIVSTPEPITRPVPFLVPAAPPDFKPLLRDIDTIVSPLRDALEELRNDFDLERLITEDRIIDIKTDLLRLTNEQSGGAPGTPTVIPDLPQVVPPEEIPDVIPEIERTTEIKAPDNLRDFLPVPVPAEPEVPPPVFTPRIAPLPGGSILEPILKKLELCCAEQEEANCCDEILAKLNEIEEKVDEVDTTTKEVDWQVNPPLPGSMDLATGSFGETNGILLTGLGNLVWVKLTMITQPFSSKRIQFGNNGESPLYYTGWLAFEIDGQLAPKIIMNWSQAIFAAPKRATGFQFTATNGSTFSGQYWYDNRSA